MALKENGTVWAWGLDYDESSVVALPTMVAGLSNIVSISAGSLFALALQNDGTVWAWGSFNGTFSDTPIPFISPYRGSLPVLAVVGGNNQYGNSNALLSSPLQVYVTDTNGVALSNSPITFVVSAGDAQLLPATNNAPANSAWVLTDTNGIATVWIQLGTTNTNTVTASAVTGSNSISVDFSEYIFPSPPVVSFTSPTNGGIYLIGSNQTLSITVNSAASAGTSVAEVEYFYQTNSGGTNVPLGVSTQSPFSFAWTNSLWWSNAFVGQYTLTAVAVDGHGDPSDPQNVTFTTALDSGGIGIPDYWQIEYFGHIGLDPASSPDGNGQSLLYDYQHGINPTDYYAGVLPGLQILSGNGQFGSYGSFISAPLVISVTGASSAALTNAPVTFTVTNGTALLAAATTNTPVSSLSLRTDTNGQVAVWVYFPPTSTNLPDSTIVVSATSTTNSTAITVNEFGGLAHWTFNNTNTWIGEASQLPLAATNVTSVPSWSSNAVRVDGTSPALLSYNVVETNGSTNITCQTGSVSFWFKPDWSSTNAGGSGPGTWGRLLEIGSNGFNLATNSWLTGSTNGWWALYLNPSGTGLTFGTATNGGGATNLSAAVSLNSNVWYQIALTYSPANSALYLDGQLLTNGTGVAYFPNAGERAGGFRIGSDQNGTNQARGAFDELETFDYPLLATNAATYGGGLPEWWWIEYFGQVFGAAASLDGQGNTLLYDFETGLDPNLVSFAIAVTNTFVNTNRLAIPLNITAGLPDYMAVLLDTNPVSVYTNGPIDFSTANWQPYPTNVVLNSGDGNYSVWIGLKGIAANATPTWQVQRLVLDTPPSVLTITNPAATVSRPIVQVQGYANETLAGLTYDISNATGVWTNQTGYITGQFADTNLLEITTNYFQCYDIPLTTNGANLITLHATDLAGNPSTTNLTVTLDYSLATNPPALTVIWPPDGTEIGGSQFTFQGQIDDPTATIVATIVDDDGHTNTVPAIVERNGAIWVQNLPLGDGENTLTITATNAGGYGSATNLTLSQSGVTVTMNPLASNMLNQSFVTATGTVSDATYTVSVNGVTATVATNGTWQATNVPVGSGGNAVFDVEATGSSDPPAVFIQPQPANVVLMSYSAEYAQFDPLSFYLQRGYTGSPIGPLYSIEAQNTKWTYQSGGADTGLINFSGVSSELIQTSHSFHSNWDTSLPAGQNGFKPNWEYNKAEAINTRVAIQPPGFSALGGVITEWHLDKECCF